MGNIPWDPERVSEGPNPKDGPTHLGHRGGEVRLGLAVVADRVALQAKLLDLHLGNMCARAG